MTEQIYRIWRIITRSEAMAIVCKSASEIEKMRQAATSFARFRTTCRTMVAPGVTTMDLERAAGKKIKELGAKPAFKGYYDYPCVLVHVGE